MLLVRSAARPGEHHSRATETSEHEAFKVLGAKQHEPSFGNFCKRFPVCHNTRLGFGLCPIAPSPPPTSSTCTFREAVPLMRQNLDLHEEMPRLPWSQKLGDSFGCRFRNGEDLIHEKNACQEAQLSHSLPITSGGRVIKSSTLLKSWNTTRPTHPPQPSGIAKLGRPNYRRGDLLKAAKKGRVGRVNDRTPRCLHEGQTNFRVCVAHSMVIQRKLLIAARKSPPKAEH